jgi:hypothetical protein
MNKLIVFALFIGLALSGCISDLNLNPDTNFNYQGNWSAPLINVHLNLGNLAEKDSLATVDENGLVHIIFREDSIFFQNIYDFTEIPEQDPTSVNFSVGSPDISISTNLGTIGGAKMKSIKISSGKLFWKTTNPVSDTISIKLELLNSTVGTQPATFTITAQGMGETIGEIDIAGLTFDLTQGIPAYNNLGFKLGIIDDGGAPNGTNLDVELKYEDVRLGNAIGFFGERKVLVPSGSFNTNLSILQNISTGLYLADPRIKLYTHSNIGLPVEINADLIGVGKNGNAVNLGLAPFSFTGSPNLGTYATDTFYINTNTSNIDNFIAAVPSEIIYSGNIEMNPAGETTTDNFITQDGELTVGMEIDLPLELRTKNLTIEQTIYNIDFGVEEGDYDFVEELSIGFRIENGFPLEADLFFYFLDSTGVLIDSTDIQLFDPAQIDANGKVIAPAKSDRFFVFTQAEIQNILKSDDIKIRVVLNTSNNGTEVVKLLSDYYIDMILGVRAKVNYSVN